MKNFLALEIRRRPSTLLWAVFLFQVLFFSPASSHAQSVKDISPRLADAITKSGKKTVAVVDFTDLQGRVTEYGRFLAEEFSVALATTPSGFKVIDRTNLKTILQEHKLASTGIIDPQTARKLGEITGVQALVTGTVTPFGEDLRISVKVLDAETAEIISGVATDMPRNKAVDELLARGIAAGDQPATVPTGKAEPPKAQPPSDSATGRIGSLLLSIQSCRPSGNKTQCTGTITNEGSKRESIGIETRNSYIVDNLGNESRDGMIYSMARIPDPPRTVRPAVQRLVQPRQISAYARGVEADVGGNPHFVGAR
jgi:TolB-like protein